MLLRATIEVLVDLPDEAQACDMMTEILSPPLKRYLGPLSDFLDWQYVDGFKPTDGQEFVEWSDENGVE